MHFDSKIVKSYDIRGVYPDQFDETFVYGLGRALPRVLGCARAGLGRDARLSSPAVYAALATGLRDAGATPVGLGLCPTEFVYYAVGSSTDLDLGVMVTASHNPPQYNGFKVLKSDGAPVTGETGLDEVCAFIRRMPPEPEFDLEPPAESRDPAADYAEFALEAVGMPEATRLKVVVDAANGVGRMLWDLISGRLGIDPIGMNMEPDGRFPAHHPDPSKRENLVPLIERVRAEGADIGFAYDGDADRVVVVTGDGSVVDGSATTACIAHRLLQRDAGCRFAVGQTVSRRVLDYFRGRGVEPEMVPVGHAKIKRVLRADPGLTFAGEDAGHYYYRDFFCCDSSLLTTLHILHLAADGELGEVVGAFPEWHRPGQSIAVEFDDQGDALETCRRVALAALEEFPEPQEITCESEGRLLRHCGRPEMEEADGVRADWQDWWFCVRPSGTEPIARLALEARSARAAQARKERLLALFDEYRAG
ncbi:MAG: hypothetical protein R6X33_17125 [Candidatus Brocadiia bacterium]